VERVGAEGRMPDGQSLMLSGSNLVVAATKVDPVSCLSGLQMTAKATGSDGSFQHGDVSTN
jgi:hypothetical protein